MRILLFGEYSNVHHTLSVALKRAGHEVLLISDGDGWKDYPRDVSLKRTRAGKLGSLLYLARLAWLLPRLRGYDVVQLINPVFLDVKARWNRLVFAYLQRHNRRVAVGCFGDDYYVVSRMQDDTYLAYTDFYAAGHVIQHARNTQRIDTWLHDPKKQLTQTLMQRADLLIACLYEYYKVYNTPPFRPRLHYIPLPIEVSHSRAPVREEGAPIHIFFPTQGERGLIKGTDQIAPLLRRLEQELGSQIVVHRIERVPFAEYQRLVAEADIVVDQLYSYTPAMAALEVLSQGKIVLSGFEPEYVDFLQARTPLPPALMAHPPIINLRPFATEANYAVLHSLLTSPHEITLRQTLAPTYVSLLHNADDVAQRYLEVWQR